MNVLLRSRSTGIVLIAIAAALWGMDAWIRQPLAQSTDVATIVFGEHLVLVLCTLPFAAGALTAVFGLGWRYVLAAVVIGAGSSAVATILFTQAFVVGTDFVTPVVLQKVQPIVAVIAARIILGERVRPRFALYLGPALVGAWLMGVPDPLHPTVHGLKPMLYALGAAVLWALGTVLGRYLARMMRFEHVTTLRFLFGLPASRDRAARARRARLRVGARHVLDRRARARHRPRRAQPLLLRPAAHAGGRRDARGARVPGQRDPRRLLQVRPDAHRLAVGRRRR